MSDSASKSFSEVAIVGAGMAGLACAAQLRAAGVPVSVFDKGRRPGGRISTCGVDDRLSFDHGCQYFYANDPIFDRQVRRIDNKWYRSQRQGNWLTEANSVTSITWLRQLQDHQDANACRNRDNQRRDE